MVPVAKGAARTHTFELTRDNIYDGTSPHTENEERDGFFTSQRSL